MALIPLAYGAVYDTEAPTRYALTLVDENGVYNRAEIMRRAMKQAKCLRTRMRKTGPKALDFEFETYVEFNRNRLSAILTALWRKARHERFNAKLMRSA